MEIGIILSSIFNDETILYSSAFLEAVPTTWYSSKYEYVKLVLKLDEQFEEVYNYIKNIYNQISSFDK